MRAEYVGTEVLETWKEVAQDPKAAMKARRTEEVKELEKKEIEDLRTARKMSQQTIVAAVDLAKIRRLLSALSAAEWAKLRGFLGTDDSEFEKLFAKGLEAFRRVLATVSPRVREQLRDWNAVRRTLQAHPPLRRKIRKLRRMHAVLKHVVTGEYRAARISKFARMKPHIVRALIAQIRACNGNCFVELFDAVRRELVDRVNLLKFLQSISTSKEVMATPSRWKWATFRHNHPDAASITKTAFFEASKQFGFRFGTHRFESKVRRPITTHHKRKFLQLLSHFICQPEEYLVLFVDESSLCPSNFKKKSWSLKGAKRVVQSQLRYEHLTMIGAVSAYEVVALQFVATNLFSALFFNFFVKATEAAQRRLKPNQKLVVVLDNSPLHHSHILLQHALRQGITLLFGLPHCSEFNLIEYFWEYCKRDIRQRTDYSRLVQ